MKVIFITLSDIYNFDESNIYIDLMNEFIHKGHELLVVSPYEKHLKSKLHVIEIENSKIVKVKIGRFQKSNILIKAINMLLMERRIIEALKKHLNQRYDMVIYATPPLSFGKIVSYIKRRMNCISYLMLKDIFPQNAVDLGIIKRRGLFSLIYVYYKKKEKYLYSTSDIIGCMSPKNVSYLKENYTFENNQIIEILPNSIHPVVVEDILSKDDFRKRFSIENHKKILIYGGNLGKPQDANLICGFLHQIDYRDDVFILIIGSGTESDKIKQFIENNNLKNSIILSFLPRFEYLQLIKNADIGLVFLDHRFTIPNFPSRILDYMLCEIPILAAVDATTDLGEIIVKNGFGYSCISDDVLKLESTLNLMLKDDLSRMGKKAKEYMLRHYNSENAYEIIIKHKRNI